MGLIKLMIYDENKEYNYCLWIEPYFIPKLLSDFAGSEFSYIEGTDTPKETYYIMDWNNNVITTIEVEK